MKLTDVAEAKAPSIPTDRVLPGTKVIKLPPKDLNGLQVNWPKTNTGHKNRFACDPEEYPNGILFTREDTSQPINVTNDGSFHSTLLVGEGKVTFDEGFNFFSSPTTGGTVVWTSLYKKHGGKDVFLGAIGCEFHVLEPLNPDGRAKWGLQLHNTQDVFIGCQVWAGHAGEHARYGHGQSSYGAPYWSDCIIWDAGAECWKQANRPEEGAEFFPDQVITIDQCTFQDWFRRGAMGGGIVLQGTGSHLKLTNTRLRSGPVAGRPAALMVDDGYGAKDHHGARAHDIHTGREIPKFNEDPSLCANGYIIIEDTAVEVGGDRQSHQPLVRVGPMESQVPHKTAQGVSMVRCGVYGRNTKVELSKIETTPRGFPGIAIAQCNTPEVRAYMEATGFACDGEPMLAQKETGVWRPFERGFHPMDFDPVVG